MPAARRDGSAAAMTTTVMAHPRSLVRSAVDSDSARPWCIRISRPNTTTATSRSNSSATSRISGRLGRHHQGGQRDPVLQREEPDRLGGHVPAMDHQHERDQHHRDRDRQRGRRRAAGREPAARRRAKNPNAATHDRRPAPCWPGSAPPLPAMSSARRPRRGRPVPRSRRRSTSGIDDHLQRDRQRRPARTGRAGAGPRRRRRPAPRSARTAPRTGGPGRAAAPGGTCRTRRAGSPTAMTLARAR